MSNTLAEYAATFTQVEFDLLFATDDRLHEVFEQLALLTTTKDERVHRQRLAEPRFAADLVPFPAGSGHEHLEEAA
ncbi:hypothetical protein ACFORH_43050 [Amycolatopsis roodepoortensis]|uniref:Uncharacterized protein n=1 Tax=Amycolatopsis roodepoortensis TaxID=700274 RepID=A0ABR9LK73_9PSEU|nr:hypothetical protein [Amycolatopsis roodepoortensis]MBE1580481.1 hypothetical protein [Amycolatopsis roodepoortensis]